MANESDHYLQQLPTAQRQALEQLRQTILALVPAAEETISTKVPAFRYRGKYLVSFSATKTHLALLVMQGQALEQLRHELSEFDTGSLIIRFTPEQPIPKKLLEKILQYRMTEIDTKDIASNSSM